MTEIKGMKSLTDEQWCLVLRSNTVQRNSFEDLKTAEGYRLVRVWVDENDIACGKCKNGQWFHYLSDGTWH